MLAVWQATSDPPAELTAASRDAVDRDRVAEATARTPAGAQARVVLRTASEPTIRTTERRLPELVLVLWCGLHKPVFEGGVEGEGVRAG